MHPLDSPLVSEEDVLDKCTLIHVKKGESLTEILSFTHTQNLALKIIIEENGILSLRDEYRGEGGYEREVQVDIILHKNARLEQVTLQEESKESNNNFNILIQQDKGSYYSHLLINKGGNKTNQAMRATLQGGHAECSFKGVNILSAKQKLSTKICVEHHAPNCTSEQFYRSVLRDWSVCTFESKSYVSKEAQKTNARQMSNALLLSPTATMITQPDLEIYADDVECAHGATTGQLDEDQIFYLRSRGIPESKAKDLLIDSFLAEILEGVDDVDI